MKCLSVSMVKAALTRILFVCHGFVATWRVVAVREDTVYWLLMIPSLAMLVLELPLTTIVTKAGEWKWFAPSVFLYLSSIVPAIWFLEEDLLAKRLDFAERQGLITTDCSSLNDVRSNHTKYVQVSGVTIPVGLSDNDWVLALQQVFMCSLILGRWLLPKGNISRDQLSQLLLVYIGMAADILEFSSESMDDIAVKCDIILVRCILGIWSWSLLQFTLVLTATKSRKPRFAHASSPKRNNNLQVQQSMTGVKPEGEQGSCCETEVWAILLSIIMQDGPYLAMRLYLLLDRNAINQMMLWFTTKNALVLCLQIYRLIVLCVDKRPKKNLRRVSVGVITTAEVTLSDYVEDESVNTQVRNSRGKLNATKKDDLKGKQEIPISKRNHCHRK
ncbi:transmembrane protein 26-like [Ptychodera flava]|uniref:transmembrane protein 26-like n=1 Tax=Ptychodera flava TaxID=63121 RepID=UPI003969D9AD